MVLQQGDYRIHSRQTVNTDPISKEYRKYVLNLDSGKTANQTRIYTTLPDGTREQIWYYNGERLYTEAQNSQYRTKKCLDRLNTSANYADIYDDNDDENQIIAFEEVSANESIYLIKLIHKDLYLCSNAESGIGSCTWEPLETSGYNRKRQQWVVERLIRVTDMPATGTYSGGIEYFSGCSSWTDNTFTRQKRNIRQRVNNLYHAVSGKNGTLSDSSCLYNFPGALACSQGASLDGYFHMGIDMVYSGNIYPYKDGTVVDYKYLDIHGYNAIGIRHMFPSRDYIFWYLHLKFPPTIIPKGTYITTSTVIGQVSNAGAQSAHLHIECQPDEPDSEPMIPYMSKIYVKGNNFGALDLLDFIDD